MTIGDATERNGGGSGAHREANDPSTDELARISVGALVMLCWALFAVAMLSGCLTQAVHPVYTEDTLVFDERLVGSFEGDDGVWTFTKQDSDSYEAVFVDEDGVDAQFEVHLAEINDALFLDLYPDRWPDDGSEMLEVTVLPVHWFFRVDEIDESLKVSAMDTEWLGEYLADFPELIEHTVADDRVVLTDDTERLQAFISAQVHNADAWTSPEEFSRLPETQR